MYNYIKNATLYIGNSICFWGYNGKYYLATPNDAKWCYNKGIEVPENLKEVEQEMLNLWYGKVVPLLELANKNAGGIQTSLPETWAYYDCMETSYWGLTIVHSDMLVSQYEGIYIENVKEKLPTWIEAICDTDYGVTFTQNEYGYFFGHCMMDWLIVID